MPETQNPYSSLNSLRNKKLDSFYRRSKTSLKHTTPCGNDCIIQPVHQL